MSKKYIKRVSLLTVLGLTIWYTAGYVYGLQSDLIDSKKQELRYETTIKNLSIQSPIEKDWLDLKKSTSDIKKFTDLEIKNQQLKERAILMTRCLKKKLIWETKSCKWDLKEYSNKSK